MPPGAPGSVTALVIYGDTIRVFFDPPLLTGGKPIVSYTLQYDPTPTFDSTASSTPMARCSSLSKLCMPYMFYSVALFPCRFLRPFIMLLLFTAVLVCVPVCVCATVGEWGRVCVCVSPIVFFC